MSTTWKDCAQRFKDLMRAETSWLFAVQVAGAVGTEPGKVSAEVFAAEAGVSASTISRYRQGWQKAAAAGVVPAAAQLTPADTDGFKVPTRPFVEFYNTAAMGLYPKRVERAVDLHGAEKIVAALSPETKRELAAEIVRTSEPAEVYRVQRAAEQRLEAEDAEGRQRRIESAREVRDARNERVGLRFAQAESELALARERMRDALENLRAIELTDDMTAIVHRRTGQIRSMADLIDFASDDDTTIDWDAELAKMGAES